MSQHERGPCGAGAGEHVERLLERLAFRLNVEQPLAGALERVDEKQRHRVRAGDPRHAVDERLSRAAGGEQRVVIRPRDRKTPAGSLAAERPHVELPRPRVDRRNEWRLHVPDVDERRLTRRRLVRRRRFCVRGADGVEQPPALQRLKPGHRSLGTCAHLNFPSQCCR
jgi:hypothetical protein